MNKEYKMIYAYYTNEYGEIREIVVSTQDREYIRHDENVLVINDFGETIYQRDFEKAKLELIENLQKKIESIKKMTVEDL